MPISKNQIGVFHNLKSGGAKRLMKDLNNHLSSKYKLIFFNIRNNDFKNFYHYLYYLYFKNKIIHKNLAKQINNYNFEKIIIHHDYLTKSPILLRYLNKKSIYICHEEPREFYNDKKYLNHKLKFKIINSIRSPLKKVDQKNLKYPNIVLANSKFSQTKLQYIYNRKVKYLKLGIDVKKFIPQNISKSNFYLTIGSTSYFKGIDFLIRSIALLPDKYKFKLIIVGDKGRNHSELVKLSKSLKVKIELKTNVSDSELVTLYNKSILHLAAAINEPFGLSILESISCGTKVICVEEGGYTDIMKGNPYGKMIKRNVKDFSKAIIETINEINPSKTELHNYINKQWNITETVSQLINYIESLS